MKLLEYGLALLVVLAGGSGIAIMAYRSAKEAMREQSRKDRQFQRDQEEADEVHDRTIHPEKYKE